MAEAQDRNFDDLIDRFESRIYETVKGDWRLKLLQEDLNQFEQSPPLEVWDAGCGQAQISLWLAGQDHQLSLCDLSSKMLSKAKANFETAGLDAHFFHQSAQSFAIQSDNFDLVLCHAVLEWMAKPLAALSEIAGKVRHGGHLSLLFYNRNAMVYSNVLKGGWRLKPMLDDSYIGKGHKLTPPNPQYPHEVTEKLENLGFKLIKHTGIRVFHDYMSSQAKDDSNEAELFALEQRYCRMPTYRDMGRYIHLLLQRN